MSKKRIEAIYPLSPMQEGLLFHTIYAPESGAYFEQFDFTLEGQFYEPAFKRAWQRLIDHNPILRTLYIWQRRDKPLQVVQDQVNLPWTAHDWRHLSPPEQQRQLDAFIKMDRARGFDLGKAPLMRLTLLRLAEERYHFIWSFHHLLLDGWSSSLLHQELFAQYDALVRGRSRPIRRSRPYRDYIQWLQQQDLSRAETFWQETLQGFTSPTPLQVNRVHRHHLSQDQAYAEQQRTLSATTTAALQALARQQRVTLNTIIQAAWALLLSRYSGERDIVFGATVSGRPPELIGVEEMVGLFINTLPVRIYVPPDALLLPWLTEIQTQQAEARQYEYTPLVQIQRWSNVAPGQPLFESLLVFENYPVNVSGLEQPGSLTVLNVRYFEKTNYPLTLIVVPGSELWLQMSYNDAYFDQDVIGRMLGHLQTLLEGIAANQPQTRLADLPLLTDAEREQMLVTWNDTAVEYAQHICLHQLFEQQVERTPDAVAAVFEDKQLSYRELNQRANQLAHYLQQLGVGPEVRVGICVERSLEMVIGLYGILKAGGAYVPLDPAYPQDRLAFMLADAQVAVLLTQQPLIPVLPASKATIIRLDADWEKIAQKPTQNPDVDLLETNLAYVIYTSGSTGKPKGAMNSHRGICNRLFWMQDEYALADKDSVLQKTPFSFDVSVWEFFWPLLTGARLVIAQPEGHKDPDYLVKIIAKHQVTTIHFVPSMLQQFLEASNLENCHCLRHVICSGEVLPYELQERFFSRLPDNVALHNLYGPTEAAVDVTYWACKRNIERQIVPIGRPIANTQIYLLDQDLQPVPIGVPGELHIGGVGLARGYLNRPELTAEKFIPNPFTQTEPGACLYKTGDLARYLPDGNIEYLHRLDHQVKIRGFRIELGEIEAALINHPAIREVVVIDRQDSQGDKTLVAYMVTSQEPIPGSAEIREHLKKKLPDYMIPTFFISLKALPMTPNGKINRNSLPEPNLNRSHLEESYIAPRDSVEQLLVNIWADVLNISQIGIYDDFFELGGHSLLATQLIFRIREAFQVELPLRNLFEEANIAGMALALATIRQAGATEMTASAIEFDKEATLDPAIRVPKESGQPENEPDHILLTGATGFLGVFLLYELLQQTKAAIYCLVRAPDIESGRQRIQSNLKLYQCWQPEFASRIIPVPGDLAAPRLGLSDKQFKDLAHQIGRIYHNGALINFVYPYYKLKQTNVVGTQEILRLATQIKTIPVHYISTTSVFDALAYLDDAQQVIVEDARLDHSDTLITGYAQSKWVAEKLVLAARDRGLPVSVYRPGVIIGDSRTGIWNTDDFLCRFIKGCIELEATYDLDEMLQLTPVDFVGKAIIHVSRQPRLQNKTFHVLSEQRLHQMQLDNWIREAGYRLEQLPYHQWRERLIQVAGRSPDHPLYPLLPIFVEHIPETEGLTIPELFTQDREPLFDRQNLSAGLAGTNIICPPIDTHLVKSYLSYFARAGFLPAPAVIRS